METAKQTESGGEGRGREFLRGVVGRRVTRGKRRMERSLRKRGRAFGRGARIGYAIQENPARAALVAFALGAAASAIWLGLNQDNFEEPEESDELDEEADVA